MLGRNGPVGIQARPPAWLKACADRDLTIPIRPEARSLNLANVVAVALFEAVRQTELAAAATARQRIPGAQGS